MLGAKRCSGQGQPWLAARDAANSTHCLTKFIMRGKQRTIENSCGGLERIWRALEALSYGVWVVIARVTQRPRLSPRAVVFRNLGGVDECFGAR